MTDKMQSKVLEHLLDSYEKSKTFQGENLVNQNFSVNIGKLFPRYQDDAEYDYFCQVNQSMEELGSMSLVTLEYQGRGILKKVRLNLAGQGGLSGGAGRPGLSDRCGSLWRLSV